MISSDQENCAVGTEQDVTSTTLAIRRINDKLRQHWTGGRVAWTQVVEQLGINAMLPVFRAIQMFDAFTPDNDPYGEHDFGAVDLNGQQFFWKIDYYDQALEFGSPDPSNPDVTTRVLTIMLASEY